LRPAFPSRVFSLRKTRGRPINGYATLHKNYQNNRPVMEIPSKMGQETVSFETKNPQRSRLRGRSWFFDGNGGVCRRPPTRRRPRLEDETNAIERVIENRLGVGRSTIFDIVASQSRISMRRRVDKFRSFPAIARDRNKNGSKNNLINFIWNNGALPKIPDSLKPNFAERARRTRSCVLDIPLYNIVAPFFFDINLRYNLGSVLTNTWQVHRFCLNNAFCTWCTLTSLPPLFLVATVRYTPLLIAFGGRTSTSCHVMDFENSISCFF